MRSAHRRTEDEHRGDEVLVKRHRHPPDRGKQALGQARWWLDFLIVMFDPQRIADRLKQCGPVLAGGLIVNLAAIEFETVTQPFDNERTGRIELSDMAEIHDHLGILDGFADTAHVAVYFSHAMKLPVAGKADNSLAIGARYVDLGRIRLFDRPEECAVSVRIL